MSQKEQSNTEVKVKVVKFPDEIDTTIEQTKKECNFCKSGNCTRHQKRHQSSKSKRHTSNRNKKRNKRNISKRNKARYFQLSKQNSKQNNWYGI